MRLAPWLSSISLLGVSLLSACGSHVTSIALDASPTVAPGSPSVTLMATDPDQITLSSPLPTVTAGDLMIEIAQADFPATTLRIRGLNGTATFSKRIFSPPGTTSYRVGFWDPASASVSMTGLTELTIPGIGSVCTRVKGWRTRFGQTLATDTTCTTSTPDPGFSGTLTLDRVTFTADTFLLGQTASTGVVGFGPASGPRALSTDFTGPGSTAFPSNGITTAFCGTTPFFVGGRAPVLLVNQELGLTKFINQGILAPATTLGTTLPNSITLADQRLSISQDSNGILRLQISPSNFDELYRINYFESRELNFRRAQCEDELSFSDSTVTIAGILGSTQRLFTLRGTTEGINAPNQSNLQGFQLTSDQSLLDGLVATADPRFSGVLNLQDVSSNQLRTDATLVIDQVGGRQTQAATSISPGQGTLSSRPPFVTGIPQPDGQVCPPDPNIICGRFQFNQPFEETASPDGSGDNGDVLVITGTVTGSF